MTRDLTKWLAFTLAEVLITLAIIGVVAGLTIPSLLANTNEKGLNTSDSVFQRRLGEALKIMNLQGTLAGQPNTQAFVDELGRHMKITKTCPSTELSNCFVSEFTSGTETIDVTKLKSSKNLSSTDYGTETIGVVFGNGTRALIAYNPKATQDQFNNSNEGNAPVRLTVPSKKLDKQAKVKLETDSLSILYILQERKNNNIHSSIGNIRDINVSFSSGPDCTPTTNGNCVSDVTTPTPLNTCDGTNKWDTRYTSSVSSNCANNYWAGAKRYCEEELGMKFPDKDTLLLLIDNDSWEGKPTSGYPFWAATETTVFKDTAWTVDPNGVTNNGGTLKYSSNIRVLCVTN